MLKNYWENYPNIYYVSLLVIIGIAYLIWKIITTILLLPVWIGYKIIKGEKL